MLMMKNMKNFGRNICDIRQIGFTTLSVRSFSNTTAKEPSMLRFMMHIAGLTDKQSMIQKLYNKQLKVFKYEESNYQNLEKQRK